MTLADRISDAISLNEAGVIGLVDRLLALCRSRPLRFVFENSELRVIDLEVNSHDKAVVPMTRSVFRAALARIAQLCNELAPGSVFPHGGTGFLVANSSDPMVFRVEFANSPDAQSLTVTPTGKGPDSEQSSLMELALLELAKSGVSDRDAYLWMGKREPMKGVYNAD